MNSETIKKLVQYVEDKDDEEITFVEFIGLIKRLGEPDLTFVRSKI